MFTIYLSYIRERSDSVWFRTLYMVKEFESFEITGTDMVFLLY